LGGGEPIVKPTYKRVGFYFIQSLIGGRKMISLQERKLGLFVQSKQLVKEFDRLPWKDYEELQVYALTGQGEFVNLVDFMTSVNSKKGYEY
jgi:hypothetical protein